ncbi:hypothetical protein Syun_010436 [Stephania yunnanensis]|uniref:Uncharacterized protein n=1 Tax=Stephania yunnanensis TaxID=152371 RepID=A0AAP0KGH9_9MAGN
MHQQAARKALVSSSVSALPSNWLSSIACTSPPLATSFAACVGKKSIFPFLVCSKFLLPEMISKSIIP